MSNDQPKMSRSEAGKLGGQSRSDRKRQSSAANVAKARITRHPGRELVRANEAAAQAAILHPTEILNEDDMVDNALTEINQSLAELGVLRGKQS